MNTLRVSLTLRSPLGTPLTADTLFGHICWGIVYHEGESSLTGLLEQMDGPDPPLVITDPLPAGFLPAPVLPPPTADSYDALYRELSPDADDAVEVHDRLRAVLRTEWIPLRVWREAAANCDAASLALKLLTTEDREPLLPTPALVAHNTIDRLSGRPREPGGLYFSDLSYPPHDGCRYEVWVRTQFDASRVSELFEWALEGGYGRDAGVGMGRLTTDAVDHVELPESPDANAVMTLGACTPAGGDPANGWWNIDIRHGKLGGPRSHDTDDSQGGVFKHPVVFLARGAVFHNETSRPLIGRMVHDVHPTRPEVVTYGYSLTVPLRLAEEGLPCQLTA